HGTRSGPGRLITGLALIAILTSACSNAVSPSPAAGSAAPSQVAAAPSVTAPPALTPAPIDTDQPGPNGGVVVRWFVGLGAGGQPQQFAAEQAFVDKLNAPDIIGPVGVEGLNLFRDQLLDLKPLIASSGFDMTKFDAGLRNFFDLGEGGATIGVPFATYPSFLWYNTKLFKEAGLPLPPTKVGEQYQGKDWNM